MKLPRRWPEANARADPDYPKFGSDREKDLFVEAWCTFPGPHATAEEMRAWNAEYAGTKSSPPRDGQGWAANTAFAARVKAFEDDATDLASIAGVAWNDGLKAFFQTTKGSVCAVSWGTEVLHNTVGRTFPGKSAAPRIPLEHGIKIVGLSCATLDDEAFEVVFKLSDGGMATCFWPIADIRSYALSANS
jgi:hypothetical protein